MAATALKKSLSIICILTSISGYTQNEASKWYFGLNSAVDFITNPPTSLNNSAMFTTSGASSIADAEGNLLFYSDGKKIWNKQHGLMLNGTLTGDAFSYREGPSIAKLPGSTNIYYIFTIRQDSANMPTRLLMYSIIDMSLAGGLGAVTVKNTLVYSNTTEKTVLVKHCNNSDLWLVTHEFNSNNFRTYLLTGTGLNPVPIISPIGVAYSTSANLLKDLKSSPDGTKLGNAVNFINGGYYEIYDFDKSTGIVYNQLTLSPFSNGAATCEFSSDGSKFYGVGSSFTTSVFSQWNLCAGSPSAIVNSVTSHTIAYAGNMQLAPDGRIYITDAATSNLSAITNPNALGSACGYSYNVLSLGTGSFGVRFIKIQSSFLQPSFSFTSGLSCQTASFTAPPPSTGCAAAGTPTLGSRLWIFGDPTSGAANTSTLTNPTHVFSAPGSYTVKLVLDYNACVADTQVKIITTPALPALTVSGNLTLCPNMQASLTVSGADSYTWSNGANTASVILNPSTTTIYTISGTNTTTSCFASKIITVTSSPCTFVSELMHEKLLVNVYPNPFQNFITIQLQKKATVKLIDVFGKVLFTNTFNEGETHLDLSNYPNSIYILNVQSKKNASYIKVLKTN